MAKVEIYTWQRCPYCIRAKALLRDKGVQFTEYEITGNAEKRAEMLARASGHHTVPQIFIDGRHIGGCNELVALNRAGGLDPLLAA